VKKGCGPISFQEMVKSVHGVPSDYCCRREHAPLGKARQRRSEARVLGNGRAKALGTVGQSSKGPIFFVIDNTPLTAPNSRTQGHPFGGAGVSMAR
jgi:hypothetical protein